MPLRSSRPTVGWRGFKQLGEDRLVRGERGAVERQQNAISNIARLAAHCRSRGIPVIHVWFVRRADARDMTLNAPLFEGCVDANAMIEGTWGAEPVQGLEAQPGDHIIRKARMSAWEGTSLAVITSSARHA